MQPLLDCLAPVQVASSRSPRRPVAVYGLRLRACAAAAEASGDAGDQVITGFAKAGDVQARDLSVFDQKIESLRRLARQPVLLGDRWQVAIECIEQTRSQPEITPVIAL